MAENGKYKVRIPDMEFWKNMIPCQAACSVHTDAGRYVHSLLKANMKLRIKLQGLRIHLRRFAAEFVQRHAKTIAVAAGSMRQSVSVL